MKQFVQFGLILYKCFWPNPILADNEGAVSSKNCVNKIQIKFEAKTYERYCILILLKIIS